MAAKVANTRRVFTSWTDFLDVATEQGPHGEASRRPDSADTPTISQATWEQTVDMAKGPGWEAALPDADRLSAQCAREVAAERLGITFASEPCAWGDVLDVGAWAEGRPDCLYAPTPVEATAHGRVVRILVPVNVAWHVDADKVKRRGAAIVALLDVLRRAQHTLEIWAVKVSGTDRRSRTGPGVNGSWACLVQDPTQPLDMGRIMFALAHPAMIRRLFWSVLENEDAATAKRFGAGSFYGLNTVEASEDMLPEADGLTIVLPTMAADKSDWTEAEAVAWINGHLDALGIGED